MRKGSLVVAVSDFTDVKKDWPMLNYPNKGDILTVSDVLPHPKFCHLNLLLFEELNNPFGICDMTHNGEWNFREIQPPMEIDLFEETKATNPHP